MILHASRSQAAARRLKYVTPGGATTFVSTYLGTSKMEGLAQGRTVEQVAAGAVGQPMAFLVEQAGGHTVDAHYHEAAQFQLFVGGSCHVGTHVLDGVTVHYAAPHSPYGPIVAGPQGVQYLTLRHDWDRGAQWMPQAAAVLRAMPNRKHLTFTSQPVARCADLPALSGASQTPLLRAAEGGPQAWRVCAGPGAVVRSDPVGAGGQFWYVLAGSARHDGASWGADDCVYVSGDEGPLICQAGEGGVELIRMAFAAGG
jgi:hypothetical protein